MSSITKPAVKPNLSKRQFELFILVVTLLLVFIMAARTPLDTDMWWHLSAGKQIVTSGSLRTPDVFSYTRPGVYWLDHSWLPDVGMYWLFTSGGFTALGLFVAISAVLSLAVLWFQMEGSPLVKAFLVILAGIIASGNWSTRPQVLTLVMMAVTGLVLYRYKWKGKKQIWLLPILSLVWANLHAGFLVLFMLVGLMIAGELLNHSLGMKGDQVLSWKSIRNLALWGLVSALAVNLNPNGFLLWLAPLRQNVGVSLALPLISEWASPDFHNPFFIPFFVMVFGMLAAIALSGRRIDLTDLLTFAWFTGMTLVSQRNMGVFAMASAPILSRELFAAWETNRGYLHLDRIPVWFENRFPSKKPKPSAFRGQHILNLSIFGILVLVGMSKLIYATSPALVNTYMAKSYPVGAVDWIKENKPQGNLFNAYNWGGFLTWYLPSYPVFIDGRVDPYGNEIIGQWLSVVKADPGWQNILDQWNVHLVLLEPDRPLVHELPGVGWQLLYQDQVSVLYGK
jgi:hypothetical protein